jgi:AraC-like DNA-binding protein
LSGAVPAARLSDPEIKEVDMPPQAPRLLRFSTEALPERDRFTVFREEFVRCVMNMDAIDRSGGRPRIDLALMPLGLASVGRFRATPTDFIRDQSRVKDGTDDFFLQIVDVGRVHCEHAGHEFSQGTAFGAFFHWERPVRMRGETRAAGNRNVTISAAALRTLVPHPEDIAGQLLPPSPALRLLDGYLQSLLSLEEAPPAELARLVGKQLVDLVAAVLGATANAKDLIEKRGLKAAQLQAILAEIERRFSNPRFNLDSVAGRVGVSRRHVQSLLAETGMSFVEHVTERRVQRARAMLAAPHLANMRIIDIALAVGFGDISQFNRMFRRRFGEAPTSVRGTAKRG